MQRARDEEAIARRTRGGLQRRNTGKNLSENAAAVEEGAEEEPDEEGDPFGVSEVAGEGGEEFH